MKLIIWGLAMVIQIGRYDQYRYETSFDSFLISEELSASIFHIIREIFLEVYVVKPFSHLAPKAYTLPN